MIFQQFEAVSLNQRDSDVLGGANDDSRNMWTETTSVSGEESGMGDCTDQTNGYADEDGTVFICTYYDCPEG